MSTSGLGPGGKSDYYGAHGLYIFDPAGQLEFYYLAIHDGISPRVIVANGPQTLVDVTVLTEADAGLGSLHYIDTIYLKAGVHYLVGFSFGSDEYDASVSVPSLCTAVNPGSTLVQKDQTDFTAPSGSLPTSGQIYAPGAGIGANLKLIVPNPRRFFVGYLSAYEPIGTGLQMGFSTPPPGVYDPAGTTIQSQTGTLGSSDDRISVWTTGAANFTLKYGGFLPNAHVDGWLLDL